MTAPSHVEVLEELDGCVNSLFALALVIRNHGTCAPAALEAVAIKASKAIALMRAPVGDGGDALADRIDWLTKCSGPARRFQASNVVVRLTTALEAVEFMHEYFAPQKEINDDDQS